MTTGQASDEAPRPRGRPTEAAGSGAFRRVNTSLYDEHLAIAARIHSNTSAAVRMALEFWALHHPAPAKKPGKSKAAQS